VQFRFGLLGPLSVIPDGQPALMTLGNQPIALAALLVSTNPAGLLAKHQSCHK